MSRKCGQIRQASSDTTVRPTRQVSDTKNCFSATTVAASSYGLKTLRSALLSHFPDTKTAFFSYDECDTPHADRPHSLPSLSYKTLSFLSHRCGTRFHKLLPSRFPVPAARPCQVPIPLDTVE